MAYNLPDGCRDDDPSAPWTKDDYKTCRICGGAMYWKGDPEHGDYICVDCGFNHAETNVPLCGFCGDSLPKIYQEPGKGYQAACPCGLRTPEYESKREALDVWCEINS